MNKNKAGKVVEAVESHNERTRTPTAQTKYVIFHRRWWRANSAWPDGLEPCASRPSKIREVVGDIETARAACREWQATHPAGKYSDKAEFQEAGSYYAAWG